VRLTDLVTLNFSNKISTAAILLEIEKSFDKTWHPGLIYKSPKLEFSTSLIKHIISFLSQRKFRVSVECEMYTPRKIKAGVPQVSVLSPTLYNLYTNYTPETISVNLALFADDGCLYATELKEGYVLRKLQSNLNSMAACCEHWDIKTNEGKTRAIYFPHRIRPPESLLTLNERNIPFVNSVKYLGVIFDKKITWRPHIEIIEAKAPLTFIAIYFLFKSERLCANKN
jgi:hypothetical protein